MQALGFILYFPHLLIATGLYLGGKTNPFSGLGAGFARFVCSMDGAALPLPQKTFVGLARTHLANAETGRHRPH